jgi:cardiolipin synthase
VNQTPVQSRPLLPQLRAAHIPNLICLARLALVWPIVAALLAGRYSTALVLIMVAGLSDGLDGFLAKRFDWRSRVGGLLDPLADKLLLVSAFVALSLTGLVPLWLTALVILRDLVIVTGGILFQVFIAPVQPEPSVASKLNTFAQLLFVVGVVASRGFGLPPAWFLIACGAAVMVTSTVSGLDYVVRWSARAAPSRRP